MDLARNQALRIAKRSPPLVLLRQASSRHPSHSLSDHPLPHRTEQRQVNTNLGSDTMLSTTTTVATALGHK